MYKGLFVKLFKGLAPGGSAGGTSRLVTFYVEKRGWPFWKSSHPAWLH